MDSPVSNSNSLFAEVPPKTGTTTLALLPLELMAWKVGLGSDVKRTPKSSGSMNDSIR